MAVEWVFDVLCYCACNVCDGLTVMCVMVLQLSSTRLGVGRHVTSVSFARFVTDGMLKKQVEQESRMGCTILYVGRDKE